MKKHKEKLTKEDKIKLKDYRKMFKKYNKLMKAAYKNAADDPFDAFPGLDFLLIHMRFMRDYYKLGWNVWATEDKDANINKKNHPTRYESLDEAIKAYEAWQSCEDEYFIHHETGGVETNRGIFINGAQQDWWIEHKYEDRSENIKKFNEEYEKRRFHFFELIATYYEDWWD